MPAPAGLQFHAALPGAEPQRRKCFHTDPQPAGQRRQIIRCQLTAGPQWYDGAGFGIVEGIMVMKIEIQIAADRVELVILELRPYLAR